MDVQEILAHVDHTELKPTAGWMEICALLDDAIKYGTASACIPPSYVRAAKDYVGDRLRICTVVGFPNGYNTTAAKLFETKEALANGADEIDMVVNLGWVKDGRFHDVLAEIASLKKAVGEKILKVIVETCVLTEEEKIRLCRVVTKAGADFIKTSTGFSTGGATFDDIRLFAANVGPNVKIKAAGGISSLADAEEFLRLGAERLGTSRIVKLVKSGQVS